jgi:FAD/FMN-containing dehydrogenase
MATVRNETIGIAELRPRFRGALVRPGEEGYDEARRVWNGDIDRRPVLIARCAGADDVVEAVRFAREHDLLVSVRGGGHSIAGLSVCDDGVMIDLSLMKAVAVDPAGRTATGAGGLIWSELDRATQQYGLATTGGVISHTGVAGLTLGGGLGHLMRSHGLTVDNLLSVDLVTADGDRLHVDADSEPELFWGLRGGGGNFGIATAFEFRLHPVGPLTLGGVLFWRLDGDGASVLRSLDELTREAPDELGVTLTMMLAPPAPFIPAEHVGKPVFGVVLVWNGEPAAGEAAIARFREVAAPIANTVRVVPYVLLQSMLDGGAPHGRHYYWKSHRLAGLPGEVVDVFLDRMQSIPTPFSQINGWAMGGAVSRVGPEATAVGEREVGFDIGIIAAWPPPDPEGDRHRSWVRETFDALLPWSTGVYANFISDEGASGVEAAYGDRLARLTALKDRYDPDNVFSLNANIPPSAGSG